MLTTRTHLHEFLNELRSGVERRKVKPTLGHSVLGRVEEVEHGLVANRKWSCVLAVDEKFPDLPASALLKMLIRELTAVDVMQAKLLDAWEVEHEAAERIRRQVPEVALKTEVHDFHRRCDRVDIFKFIVTYRLTGRVAKC